MQYVLVCIIVIYVFFGCHINHSCRLLSCRIPIFLHTMCWNVPCNRIFSYIAKIIPWKGLSKGCLNFFFSLSSSSVTFPNTPAHRKPTSGLLWPKHFIHRLLIWLSQDNYLCFRHIRFFLICAPISVLQISKTKTTSWVTVDYLCLNHFAVTLCL